jgi:hypothetical protein
MNRSLIEAALRDVDTLKDRLERLLATTDQQHKGTPKVVLKKDNGRLTDAGIRYVRDLIDGGRSDSEIARELDVTPTAIWNQRNRYFAEKAAPRWKR